MSVTELDALAHRLESEDPDLFLGKVFWYHFSEVRVDHNQLVYFFTKAGITKNLPLIPDDVDVFKRVCTSVKRMKVKTANAAVTANYVMPSHREFRDGVSVVRRIVREEVDSKGQKLAFVECADLVFDRKTGVVTVRAVDNTPMDIPTAEMADEAIKTYETWRGCLNTYGVREWVRAYIQRLGATCIRPGGAFYFVKLEHDEQLERLEHFASLLTEADCGSIEFSSLPLVDDRKQRLFLQRAFEAETAGAIDTKLEEISGILGGTATITSERYSKIVDEYQGLVGKTKDYEELLQDTLQNTGSRLKIYKKSLVNLMGKVET